MIEKPEADEKVQKGWLRVWMAFDAIGVNEEVVKKALEGHMDKIDQDERIKLYKKQFSDVKKMEKPLKNIEVGYAYNSQVEATIKNLEDLVQLSIEYGPSGVEILEPKDMKITSSEAQSIVNGISHIMHQFAAAGLGGVVLVQK